MNIKQQLIDSIKEITKDRYLAILLVVFLLLCTVAIGLLIFQIHPSDLQVVVHYTGFGLRHYYTDKWYYLITFITFIVVMAIVHSAASYKILQRKGHDFAAAFVWFSIILVLMTLVIFYQILKIASL